MKLTIGNRYKFKFQSEILIFVGKEGLWNQFEKLEHPDVVWCEVTDGDLHLIEESLCDH